MVSRLCNCCDRKPPSGIFEPLTHKRAACATVREGPRAAGRDKPCPYGLRSVRGGLLPHPFWFPLVQEAKLRMSVVRPFGHSCRIQPNQV